MGKAYTPEEKEEIKKRIWEEALSIMHQGEAKDLNMRDLTEKVGISLGSYYNFYKDKKTLIYDIMQYRAKQKLDVLKESFQDSVHSPVKYVFQMLIQNVNDMGYKVMGTPIYRSTFTELFGEDGNISVILPIFKEFFCALQNYWDEQEIPWVMDIEGILSLLQMAVKSFDVAANIKKPYFEELLIVLIESGCEKYITKIS